jgi:hypothetical protein
MNWEAGGCDVRTASSAGADHGNGGLGLEEMHAGFRARPSCFHTHPIQSGSNSMQFANQR